MEEAGFFFDADANIVEDVLHVGFYVFTVFRGLLTADVEVFDLVFFEAFSACFGEGNISVGIEYGGFAGGGLQVEVEIGDGVEA